jgi:hypothetical protein
MSRNDITGDKIATKPAPPDWQYSADGYTRTDGKVVEQLVSTGWSEYWERVN